jgi:hypothetical protein
MYPFCDMKNIFGCIFYSINYLPFINIAVYSIHYNVYVFRVTLALAYDNLFLNNVCGGDHAVAKTRVEKIISLAQTYFLYSATLGTKITLVVKEIKHTNHELKLRSSGVTCDKRCQM